MQLYFLQLAHLVKIHVEVELQQGAGTEKSSASKRPVLLFALIAVRSNIKHQLFIMRITLRLSCLLSK